MRTRFLLVAALVAVAVLTGCGGDEKTSDSGPKTFSQEDLTSALLQADDIGADYRIKADDGEEDDAAPGCLKAISETRDGLPNAKEKVEVSIQADSANGIPEVDHLISSFEDSADAEAALTGLVTTLADCSTVTGSDDGVSYDIAVATDETTIDPRVGDQFNLDATGTLASQGQEFAMSIRIRFMRVDNVIVTAGISSIVETDTAAETDDLAELALARVVALLDGVDQPELEPLDLAVVG